MKIPRWRWSDLQHGKPFEIIIDKFLDAEITHYYNKTYVVFQSLLDLGIDKKDIRKCEFTIPLVPFLRAFQGWPTKDRMKFKTKKMKLVIIKNGWKKMEIKSMEEVDDLDN